MKIFSANIATLQSLYDAAILEGIESEEITADEILTGLSERANLEAAA